MHTENTKEDKEDNVTKDKQDLYLLSPKIDVVFHALFRRANNTLLEAMLSAIIGKKIKITSNLDRYLDVVTADEKFGIMDLRV